MIRCILNSDAIWGSRIKVLCGLMMIQHPTPIPPPHPQHLIPVTAKVDVTGTNYQCQIIIVKKRLMLARDMSTDKSWDIKQNA